MKTFLILLLLSVNYLQAQKLNESNNKYVNNIKNYSFIIPTGWKQISKDYLMSSALTIGNDVYDVGIYKFGDIETGLHPIITANFRIFKIDEKDYLSIANKLILDSKLENLKSKLTNSEALDIVNNMKINQAYFDNKLNRLYFNIGYFEDGKLVGKGLNIFIFCQKGLLSIGIIDNPKDWNENINEFYSVINSLKY